MKLDKKNILLISLAILVTGCGGAKPGRESIHDSGVWKPSLVRISDDEYPLFTDDIYFNSINEAAGETIRYLSKIPESREFRYGEDSYTTSHIKNSVRKFRDFTASRPSVSAMNKFIKDRYTVYKSTGAPESGKVLFTGYYEPFLKGSLKRTNRYRYPLYAVPYDLGSVSPYHDRLAIEEKKAIHGKARVIAWVDDRIDLFFLQVQGSGIIFLDSGKNIKVHYHKSNGHPYTSIGKYFIEKGIFIKNEISMQKMREWFDSHPEKVTEILGINKSYVFFKEEPAGPIGCLNVKLTPGRSLALDRKIYPDAGLAFVATEKPLVELSGKVRKWMPFSRFIFNQDTGGAITGPGRADFFWGNGEYAKTAAGHMKNQGELYFLVLKTETQDYQN